MKESHNMAIEYVTNGTDEVTRLTEKEIKEFAIQLFSEEDDKSNQISMLVESDYFFIIPELLIALTVPQDPYPSNNITSDAINSLVRDNIKDKISTTLIKCLIETYTLEMQRLLDYAKDSLYELDEQENNDDIYT